MIIRLIGDNWVPEDKALISVQETDEVKSSLPNMMKKLGIKRMIEYKLYHTLGERKCDFSRPIDQRSTWKQLDISGGSCVYLSKKDPVAVEGVSEEECHVSPKEDKEEKEGTRVAHVDASARREVTLSDIGIAVEGQVGQPNPIDQPSSAHSSIHQMETGPLLVESSAPLHAKASIPLPELYGSEGKTEAFVLGRNQVDSGWRKQDNVAPFRLVQALGGVSSYCEEKKHINSSFSPDMNYQDVNGLQVTPMTMREEGHVGGVEHDISRRRYERAAYLVSLYEFAHLELRRQRWRAEEVRREAARNLPHPQLKTLKPLYKI